MSNMNSMMCYKCDEELVLRKTVFEYLSSTFSHEVPVCPACNRVYIPRELALGKMSEVEQQLEDK